MNYDVKIDGFEGPLDLLWHLIQETKMDIYEVSITEITDQYLKRIQMMEEISLEIAAEYLFIAAQLIEYKSRKLLPVKEEETESLEDFRHQLIERLLIYKQFKEVSKQFKEMEYARNLYFTSVPQDVSQYQTDIDVIFKKNKTGTDLLHAYVKMLQREKTHRKLETVISHEVITVEAQISFLEKRIPKGKKASFRELVENQTKQYRVTMFLALLQLCREMRFAVEQSEIFGEIIVKSVEGGKNQ